MTDGKGGGNIVRTRRFVALLAAVVILLNLFSALYAYWSLDTMRSAAHQSAAQWTRSLSLALSNEVAAIVRATDLVLHSITDEISRQQTAGTTDSKQLYAHFAPLKQRFPYIDGVRMTDARGVLISGSDVRAGVMIDLSDREHFRKLRDHDTGEIAISQPQQSRVNGKWVVAFARRINNQDGSFAGMVFIAIPIENLASTFSQLASPEGSSFALRDANLRLLARIPNPADGENLTGKIKVQEAYHKSVSSGAIGGTFNAISQIDGVFRVVSFHKVAEYPLYMNVGRARHEYLQEWYEIRLQTTVTLSLFLIVTLLLSVLLFRSWQKQAHARNEMERISRTDYLTGIPNRLCFTEKTEHELARSRRYEKPLSLLIFDIDHFKLVNDSCGHSGGDEILRGVVSVALATLRDVDFMGRWGGEEFVVLMPETGAASAAEAAERLRATIAEAELNCCGNVQKITVSIGYSESAADDAGFEQLLQRADAALYRAKGEGRNRVCGG